MDKLRLITVMMLFSYVSVACTPSTPVTDTPEEFIESRVVISEVMAGIEGNNNFEFIELHNTGDEIIDLQGWSLWYQLTSDKEQVEIYAWDSPDVIPPHGHYLMGRAGENLDIVVDAEFEQPLVVTKGGLLLKRSDGSTVDALGWGQAPEVTRKVEQLPLCKTASRLSEPLVEMKEMERTRTITPSTSRSTPIHDYKTAGVRSRHLIVSDCPFG